MFEFQRYHGRETWRLPSRALALATIAVAAAWWIVRRPFRVAVAGTSMAPELSPEEFLVAVRAGTIRRRDLVIVPDPRRSDLELVKRVVGVPGDRIGERTLGAGEYWIEGANAPASTDSRTFGPVGGSVIRGVVRLRYWPPSRIKWF